METHQTIIRHGDKDPEDAWDSGDMIDTKVRILHQIVDSIGQDPDPKRSIARIAKARKLLDGVEQRLETLLEETQTLRQRLGG